MKRSELEHVIRAASAITLHDEFIVIGSQALLAAFPDAPTELVTSMEVDLYPRNKPEDSILIDGAIGERSTFEETFGYYGHGVGPDTATLPAGWEERLIPLRSESTGGATAWCLEVHDLAISKLVAGREKDLRFVAGLIGHGLAESATLIERLAETQLPGATRELCGRRLDAWRT